MEENSGERHTPTPHVVAVEQIGPMTDDLVYPRDTHWREGGSQSCLCVVNKDRQGWDLAFHSPALAS